MISEPQEINEFVNFVGSLIDFLFTKPGDICERIDAFDEEALDKPMPTELIINPDLLCRFTLYGLPVKWDSSLPPGAIELR